MAGPWDQDCEYFGFGGIVRDDSRQISPDGVCSARGVSAVGTFPGEFRLVLVVDVFFPVSSSSLRSLAAVYRVFFVCFWFLFHCGFRALTILREENGNMVDEV